VWITACSAALSVPGGVKDAQGAVLPSSIGGAKSASKYLSRVMASLRAGLPSDETAQAIKTLELLIKSWQKAQAVKALELVRRNKISWGTVVLAGSPTETKKGKRGLPDTRVVSSPSKPSQSPWLSQQERSKLAKIFADEWSRPDKIRVRWIALSPEEQHSQYHDYVKELKDHYADISRISSSIHAKLGHRKNWIYKAVTENGLLPKSKKYKEDNFKISSIFFSSVKLTSLGMSVKKLFSPVEYLSEERFRTQTTWGELVFPDEDTTITTSYFSPNDGEAYELWQIWATKFVPVFPAKTAIPEAQGLRDDNPFVKLGEAQAS